jgi:hypothetical protein
MGNKGKSFLHFFYTLPLERVVRSRAIIDAADSSPFYAIVGAHHSGLFFSLKQSDHIKIRCGASTSTEASAFTHSPVPVYSVINCWM